MSTGPLGDPSLFQQTQTLLWKNVLLKWRRKWNTFLDWLQDLSFVVVIFCLASIMRWDTSNRFGPSASLGRLDEFTDNLTVGYMSASSTSREIMQRLIRSSKRGVTVKEFKNEEDILQHILNNTITGVAFDDPFKYGIRNHYDVLPSPNDYLMFHGECYNGSEYYCMARRYWSLGFLYLQANIDSAIIEMTTGKSMGNILTSIQAMKIKSIQETWGHIPSTWKLIVTMCMSYTSLTYLLSIYITRERHEMLEIMKTMRMMGLAFWLSWGLLYTVYVIVIANLLAFLMTTYLFVESSYGGILLLFTLYGLASISFSFLLSSIFRTPRVTVFMGFLVTFFISTSGLLLLVRSLPKTAEVLLCIFHPFAFAVGFIEALHLEKDAQGVFFSEMAGDSSKILYSYISLTLDTILYMMLTLYLEKVLPDKHGIKHEPLFFTRPSFWRREKSISPLSHQSSGQKESKCGEHIEKVPNSLFGKEAIRINNVKKIYNGEEGIVEALKGVDFDVYEGQITALLGHGGAGKTTLLNILSGMCRTTSGSASIYNYDLSDRNNTDDIHRIVGICPQFDVKFDPLTVKENLKVFAQIKGISSSNVEQEVMKVISCLQLTEIQNLEAETLSSGQRRMLTLGIALLGDPKVLLLDEPTAGLDPLSRYQVWASLKEMKVDKVMLISTQFMEEADILADRKAVISGGQLKCLGSSHFLKRKWGTGYHLRIHVTSSCDPEATTSLIQQHISGAKLSAKCEQELTFILPIHCMDAFPDLFSHLEECVGHDIVSYGVSMMSLNDVFLKVDEEAEADREGYREFNQEITNKEEREDRGSEAENSIQLMVDASQAMLSDLALWKLQVLAVARMRFLKLKYNRTSFGTILLLLLCFIVPMVIYASVTYHHKASHRMELESNMYFMTPGERESSLYSRLLICNNTGSPIEDFTEAVKSQDIAIEVTNGPHNPDTTRFKGAIEVSRGIEGYRYTIIGNFEALNSLPVLLNIISNSVLKMFKSKEHIRIWREGVFPGLEQENEYEFLFESLSFMMVAAAMAPHFAMTSIEDTRIKARSQLHISGLFPSAYWCGQALVDIPFYWILLSLMIAIIFLFNYTLVLSSWLVCLLIFEIIGYGAAIVLYVYLIAFIFRSGKSRLDWWSFFFLVIPLIPSMIWQLTYSYLELMDSFIWPFLFPSSALIHTLYLILFTYWDEFHFYHFNEIVLSVLLSYIHIVLFSGALWCLEWKYGRRSLKRDPLFRTSKRKDKMNLNPEDLEDADEEVLAERERVKVARATQHQEEPLIVVSSLRKEFDTASGAFCFQRRKRVATKNISFCVRRGEILGLLGPNGAGKTTSLSMIAGELIPTAGEVHLCATDSSIGSFETIGYCCQDNPLWPDVTVWEHLKIYAAIKGTKKEDVDTAVRRIVEALDLKDHIHKPAKKLSMAISRKLCLAIGMLGNPTVLLLDEPSSGLDPKGRQRLWKPIRAAIRNKQRGAILTTHYMEDAEAICDRVAIMVSGKLQCIGSIQQLKDKFGRIYQLEMKVKDSQHADLLHQEIIRMFPQAARQERFSSLLVYKIPKDDVQSLSKAFLQLEEAKRLHNIEEYSFSQPTLEQVFLELMKEQDMEDFDV